MNLYRSIPVFHIFHDPYYVWIKKEKIVNKLRNFSHLSTLYNNNNQQNIKEIMSMKKKVWYFFFFYYFVTKT